MNKKRNGSDNEKDSNSFVNISAEELTAKSKLNDANKEPRKGDSNLSNRNDKASKYQD